MHMCKTKMAVDASDPNSARRSSRSTRPTSTPSSRSTPSRLPTFPPTARASASTSSSSATYPTTSTGTSSTSTISSRTSLTSIRGSISQSPHIYDISEIRSATNNFLAKPYSSSSSSAATSSASSAKCWRCNLRDADTIVFQRKFRRKLSTSDLKDRLSVICRSHHVSVVKLLGASVSGEHIYLVYEFVPGANLSDCLRNRINPNYTVLSTWISRIQIATDIADALDYIHNKTGLNLTLVHNHIKSTGIIITEPSLKARICHFAAAYLCGDIEEEGEGKGKGKEKEDSGKEKHRSFEGVRGYMSPEFQKTGIPTQKSDVYAFGVLVLELVSGEEPFKYRFDKGKGDFVRTSVIETAHGAVEGGGLRRWVDKKLNDSFPVEVVEKLIRLALDCVHVDPGKRPDMGRVAYKVSRLYLDSTAWSDARRLPTDQISVSLAPR